MHTNIQQQWNYLNVSQTHNNKKDFEFQMFTGNVESEQNN